MRSERQLWVLELFNKQYGWLACEGDQSRKHMWKRLREARAKYPKDKLRVVKYCPYEESFGL